MRVTPGAWRADRLGAKGGRVLSASCRACDHGQDEEARMSLGGKLLAALGIITLMVGFTLLDG